MKKISSLILAGLLAFSLAACGGDDSSSAPAADSTPSVGDSTPESAPESTPEAEGEGTGADVAAEGTVTIVHELGTTEVPVNPEKSIVLDLGVLDMLDDIGLPVGGVPQSANLPDYLEQYFGDEYINTGGMKEIDLEAINEYGPDIIYISGRLSDYYDECAEIAPTVYMPTPGATYMETFKANVDNLALIYPDKADVINTRYDGIVSSIDELNGNAAGSGLTALFVMANDNALSVFGEGSRYAIVHDDFGFVAADSDIDASTHGEEASFEYIKDANPDILFVMDRSAAIGTGDETSGAEVLLDNDLIASTTAVQEGRVVYLASDIWYLVSGGFVSTERMVAECASVLG